ncbi:MAG: hypothetical protein ABSC38_02940 [Verrucomicrobiia bacterium]
MDDDGEYRKTETMASSLSLTEIKQLLSENPDYSRIDTFVETGTNQGRTIFLMQEHFRELHTVELSKRYYLKVMCRRFVRTFKKLFWKTPGAISPQKTRFYLGDSAVVIKQLAASINKPAVFFLDSHCCGTRTARGQKDVPLLEELGAISQRKFPDLIIIDDARLFGTSHAQDWLDITKENMLKCFPKDQVKKHYVSNDRFILLTSPTQG